jgi:sirohydrochlorin ferrochelatase
VSALVIVAHGSVDPRFAEVVEAIAAQVAEARTDLKIRTGYLGHGTPFETVATPDDIVVPLLLTNGFHVRKDIPTRFAGTVTRAIGPDRRLTVLMARRLREAGWSGEALALAATGSSDPRSQADVHQMARDLGDELGREVSAGFLSDGEPALLDLEPVAVATYLLAPGRFADAIADCGASIIAAPLGADPLVAEIVLDRYDGAAAH